MGYAKQITQKLRKKSLRHTPHDKSLSHYLIFKFSNLFYLLVFSFSFFTSSCVGPKIVPDDELAEIFRDIYLTNSYLESHHFRLDSLSVYEPIFKEHGYTSEDIQYTLGDFAKRKSASISADVVAPAMEMLREDGAVYVRALATQDTVRNMAGRRFRKEGFFLDSIVVRRVADTARLTFRLPAEAGSYRVEFGYLVDTIDKNAILRTDIHLLDANGRRMNNTAYRLGRSGRGHANQSIEVDTSARTLVVDLNGYPNRDISRPSMRIDSLRVTHYLPEAAALDSLYGELYDYFVYRYLHR